MTHLLGEVLIAAQPGFALLLLALGIGIHPLQLSCNALLQPRLLPALSLHNPTHCCISSSLTEQGASATCSSLSKSN